MLPGLVFLVSQAPPGEAVVVAGPHPLCQPRFDVGAGAVEEHPTFQPADHRVPGVSVAGVNRTYGHRISGIRFA